MPIKIFQCLDFSGITDLELLLCDYPVTTTTARSFADINGCNFADLADTLRNCPMHLFPLPYI